MENEKNISNEELFKEIELIQNCITRMAKNSFQTKSWLIGMYVAILGLLSETVNNDLLMIILIIETIIFWTLDAFYLRKERQYRKLYSWVIKERKNGNKELQYELNLICFKEKINNQGFLIKIMFSATLWPFYISLLIISILALIFNSTFIEFIINIYKVA